MKHGLCVIGFKGHSPCFILVDTQWRCCAVGCIILVREFVIKSDAQHHLSIYQYIFSTLRVMKNIHFESYVKFNCSSDTSTVIVSQELLAEELEDTIQLIA